MTRVRITLGEITVTATFNDSQTAALLEQALPFEAHTQVWGDEVYFTTPVDAEEENAQA